MPVTITGTEFNDDDVTNPALRGALGTENLILGLGGNDVLYGGTDAIGPDRLIGGMGDDTLYSGGANGDILEGGDGNDILYASPGDDHAYGGAGNDVYRTGLFPGYYLDEETGNLIFDWTTIFFIHETPGQSANDVLELQHRWDSENLAVNYTNFTLDISNSDAVGGGQIIGLVDNYTVDSNGQLQTGVDFLKLEDFTTGLTLTYDLRLGGFPQDYFLFTGTSASQTLTGDFLDNVIDAREGDDTIQALGGSDLVTGGDGNDTIYADDNVAGGGEDRVYGGNGQDTVYGGAWDDSLYGQRDGDWLYGESGDDFIDGGSGNDTLNGGFGNDTLYGRDGVDYVFGGSGNDYINGGSGNGVLYGDDGNDSMAGANDRDWMYGDAGNDSLRGYDGIDELNGGTGDDKLYAGAGNDLLNGNTGVDRLYGEAGADTFRFDDESLLGRDRVMDFSLAQGDRLELWNLLQAFDPLTHLITDFVRISESTGNSYLSVDVDGLTNGRVFTQIARLDGATGLTDEAALYANSMILVS